MCLYMQTHTCAYTIHKDAYAHTSRICWDAGILRDDMVPQFTLPPLGVRFQRRAGLGPHGPLHSGEARESMLEHLKVYMLEQRGSICLPDVASCRGIYI